MVKAHIDVLFLLGVSMKYDKEKVRKEYIELIKCYGQYSLLDCDFYNLSVNEIKNYFELFDAMPEKLKEVLIDKMNNGEFTIKNKDEDF